MTGGLINQVGGFPNTNPGGCYGLKAAMHGDLSFGLLEGLGFGLGAGHGLGLGWRRWRFGWRRVRLGEWRHGLLITSEVIVVWSPKIQTFCGKTKNKPAPS